MLVFSSCAGLSGLIFNKSTGHDEPSLITPEANRLLVALYNKNREIKTFKGTGRMNLSNKNSEVISADIAWVAENNDKIYIAVRGILGQPIAGIATDGKYVYFASHTEKVFHKKRSDNADLKRFISIPIKIKDIILFLSGRSPVCAFDTASAEEIEGKGIVLVLKNKAAELVEKIYFDNDGKNVMQIDMFDSGDLLYRVFLNDEMLVKEYHIPSKLIISDEPGNYFKLDINRYWADEPVSSSVFVLKPPE
ncbi:hypothetical protein [Desulfobacterium sp. N47]|uniref:Lipoprotein n=1 Tax=uncultured Desulfobacterium sp. TaxID=201089 RepID=E1YH52_9BACT|nr:hypothetical protein N47_F15910 [uncultured Desulfobacterium sp.]